MPPADGAATLTAFTAAAIARIVPLLPKRPKSWIVCGGGARNLTMMRMLRERLEPATVEAAETLGWASDAIEAQAFGFLAARGLKGLPLSYPATTGVPMPDDRRGDRAAVIRCRCKCIDLDSFMQMHLTWMQMHETDEDLPWPPP